MRLFVAVHVGNAALARAEEVRRLIEGHDPELARRGMKWVAPGQMHLTLRFLGEVASDMGDAVAAAVEGRLEQQAFPLGFGPPSWLPPRGRPRVLVMPVDTGADALLALKRAVDERLPSGVPLEEARPFRPHLTIARVRDEWQRRAEGLAPVLGAVAAVRDGGVVDVAVLFESHLGPRGPVYDERARLSLVAPTG